MRQEDLAKLRLGQAAYVTVPGKRLALQGKITNLGQQFDPATRVMQVRIELAIPTIAFGRRCWPTRRFPVGEGKPVLLVPSDAVQQVNGQDVVFVRTAPDRFAVRPVSVGETSGGKTPILEGIKAGDTIVVRGSFILKSQLLEVDPGERVAMLNRIIDLTLQYRWLASSAFWPCWRAAATPCTRSRSRRSPISRTTRLWS